MSKKLVSYRLDEDLLEFLKKQAEFEGITTTELVNRLLWKGIKQNTDLRFEKRLIALEELFKILEIKVNTNTCFSDKLLNTFLIQSSNQENEREEKLAKSFKNSTSLQLLTSDRSLQIAQIEDAIESPTHSHLLQKNFQEKSTLKDIKVECGTKNSRPKATLLLRDSQEKEYLESAEGDGPVDAAYQAIDKAFKRIYSFQDYQLLSITAKNLNPGSRADVLVSVIIEYDYKLFPGSGIDKDLIRAASEAYIEALNQIYAEVGT